VKGVLPLVLQLLQFPPCISIDIFLLGICTLVMLLLTPTEGDLYLYQVAPQIDGSRDEGEAPLVDFTLELLYLSLMGKQPSVSQRLVVVEVPMGVGLDGQSYQGQGLVSDSDVAVGEAELAIPYGLYLGTHQGNATLQVFYDLIVEVGLPIFLQKLEFVLVLFHLVFPGNAKPYEVAAGSSIDNSHCMFVYGGGSVEIASPLHSDIREEVEALIQSCYRLVVCNAL